MKETLTDYFDHDEPVVSAAARFLADIQEQYEAGNISKSEFKELAQDALEIDDVYGLAGDLDRKAAVSKALAALEVIASFIPI